MIRLIDLGALSGLRGYSSIWIVLFHCFHNSGYTVELSNIVQIFYILSGFSLSVAYGLKKPTDLIKSRKDSKMINWQFYQNRLARVLPVYYFALLLVIPIYLSGFGVFEVNSIIDDSFLEILSINIIPIQSWLMGFFGTPLNFPSWTVCTLIFMWIFFPYVNEFLKSKSDKVILQYMSYCYWFNVLFVLFGLYSPYPGVDFMLDLGVFTTNPVTRFPIFLIGMCAGLLCIRHPEDRIPWPRTYFLLFPSFSDHFQRPQDPAINDASEELQPLISSNNQILTENPVSVKSIDRRFRANSPRPCQTNFYLTNGRFVLPYAHEDPTDRRRDDSR